MLFTETLAALAAGERVAATHLVLFNFAGVPFRAWENGAGILRAAGVEWNGLGRAGRIAALPLGVNDSAGQASFALSGVDPDIVRRARSESDKVAGREVTVWLQFLSAPQKALDERVFLGSWIMDSPRFKFSGPQSSNISITARSIFDDRKKSAFAHYTDSDQEARFPGDRFLEFVSEIAVGKTVFWPQIP